MDKRVICDNSSQKITVSVTRKDKLNSENNVESLNIWQFKLNAHNSRNSESSRMEIFPKRFFFNDPDYV